MNGYFRISRFNILAGIAVVVALLLALQVSLAPTLGQKDRTKHETYLARGTYWEDYSCTAGATGNCRVTYTTLLWTSQSDAERLCGASVCVLRLEVRW